MAGLTKEYLIENMIVFPSNDIEVGFNAALLVILKKLVELNGATNEPPLYVGSKIKNPYNLTADEIELKSRVKDDLLFDKFKQVDIYQLFTYLRSNPSQKINALKHFKEMSGYGLAEAKDVIDSIRYN